MLLTSLRRSQDLAEIQGRQQETNERIPNGHYNSGLVASADYKPPATVSQDNLVMVRADKSSFSSWCS